MERPNLQRTERHCVVWDAVVTLPGRAPLKTRLFDISRTGVRVRLDQPVANGQILPIDIHCRQVDKVSAQIVVVRCTLVPAGYYIAGAKLISVSPPDRRIMDNAIKDLQAAAANSHTANSRAHPFKLWRLFAR